MCMCSLTPLSWGPFCGGELVYNVVCDLWFHAGDAKVRECCFIIVLQVLTWYIGGVID